MEDPCNKSREIGKSKANEAFNLGNENCTSSDDEQLENYSLPDEFSYKNKI